PKYAQAYTNLGAALRDKHDLEGAIASYKKALELDPKYAPAHYNLGIALRAKGRLDEAVAEYRQAVRFKTGHPESHLHPGLILQEQGRFDEALAALRRGHELGTKQPGWRYPSAQWVRKVERMLVLEMKLPAILTGKATPTNPGEAVVLASMCQQAYKKLYAT